MSTLLSRRALVATASALAVTPVLAAPALPSPTPIAALWDKAERLKRELSAYCDEITARTKDGGIPGWMRLATEANRIGSERYDALVAILNAEPKTQADLAMMAKAALSDEMWLGPMTWAGEKLARATIAFNERVA